MVYPLSQVNTRTVVATQLVNPTLLNIWNMILEAREEGFTSIIQRIAREEGGDIQ